MIITLTAPELAMLSDMIQGDQTIEDVIHSLLAPLVLKHSETRLQVLAELYRQLTPEDRVEAIELLKQWQISKRVPKEPSTDPIIE